MKVGLVGLGSMGSAHFSNYNAMKENGVDVELVAICDVDPKKIDDSKATEGNLGIATGHIDLSPYHIYSDMAQMIRNENLDYVDICLPTYLHAPMSIQAMELGVHVFCEKPMSLSAHLCQAMIDTAKRTGKLLMIGHTLRYWDAYLFAKDYVERNVFGKCVGGYFYRGGGTPIWSWENWLMQKEKSGGCLLDQHVHDIDAIVWMFGLPKAVSTSGINCIPGSGYDIVSTNYLYEDGKVINAQDDWTINGEGYGFSMVYRLNFERGALVYEGGKLMVHPVDGEAYEAAFPTSNPYYDELILFSKLIKDHQLFDYIALLESHKQTIQLAEAEQKSAEQCGQPVTL